MVMEIGRRVFWRDRAFIRSDFELLSSFFYVVKVQ